MIVQLGAFQILDKIYKKINIYKDTILNEKIIKKLISKTVYVSFSCICGKIYLKIHLNL